MLGMLEVSGEVCQVCQDPKDGDLCLRKAKSGETLMEACSDTDVQHPAKSNNVFYVICILCNSCIYVFYVFYVV